MTHAGAPVALRAATAALVVLLVLGGCASKEEKVETHLQRAEGYLAKGDAGAAVVELRSALQLAPKNGAINLRIADVLMAEGQSRDALFFYEEAMRLDPSLDDARLGAVQVLASSDAERAEKLVDEVLAHDPSNALAHAALANIELQRRDVDAALKAALVAMNLAPDDPHVQLQLGRVYQAQIQVLQNNKETAKDEIFVAATTAFEAAARNAGSDLRTAVTAGYERARVLAAWPGHLPDAERAFLDLMDRVKDAHDPILFGSTRNVALQFASAVNDPRVFKNVIEKTLSIDPSYLPAWRQLAAFEMHEGRSPDAVFDRLLSEQPRSSEAYVLYADFLARQRRSEDALGVLHAALPAVEKPQVVRGALVDVLYRLGRSDEAVKTIEEMERDDPKGVETQIASATRAMREKRFRDAGDILTSVSAQSEQLKVFLMLAQAKLRTGEHELATRAIDKGFELAGPSWTAGLRLRLEIQSTAGDWLGVLKTARELQSAGVGLSGDQRVLAAQALYETGQVERGRKALEKVLAEPNAPIAARVTFARREGSASPDRSRALLEAALKEAPNNGALIQELAVLDSLKGDTSGAIARMDRLLASLPADDPAPGPHMLRAQLRRQAGDAEGGEQDAIAAFRAAPATPGAAELLAAMAVERGRVPQAVSVFEEVAKTGAMPQGAQSALARLYIAAGRDDDALRLLEELVKTGGDAPTKNDLAYLLAKQGRDLDRALTLAQEVVGSADSSAAFADTLGYVYLQKKLYAPALSEFDRAIELAKQVGESRPEYHYRRGLALQELERREEALHEFEAALAIDPGFKDAENARAALEKSREAAAKQSS